MLQEIFTYIIISLAAIYTLWGILKLLGIVRKKHKHACESGACSSCNSKGQALQQRPERVLSHKYFSAR